MRHWLPPFGAQPGSIAAHCPRRLADCAQESAAHPFTIGQSGLMDNGLDRMSALFEHLALDLHPKRGRT